IDKTDPQKETPHSILIPPEQQSGFLTQSLWQQRKGESDSDSEALGKNTPCATANPAIALSLQAWPLVSRVAGSLYLPHGRTASIRTFRRTRFSTREGRALYLTLGHQERTAANTCWPLPPVRS